MTSLPEDVSFPSWSPDGKGLVYTLKEESTRKLMVSDVESGSTQVLFEQPSHAGMVGPMMGVLRFPVWSSDGDRVFVAYYWQVHSFRLENEEQGDTTWIVVSVVIGVVAVVAVVALFKRRGRGP